MSLYMYVCTWMDGGEEKGPHATNGMKTVHALAWALGPWGTGFGTRRSFVIQGGGGFSTGKFLSGELSAGKIPPQSLKVMGKIAPHFSMVKGKA